MTGHRPFSELEHKADVVAEPEPCMRCQKRPRRWRFGSPLCTECAVEVGMCLDCHKSKYDPALCTC